MARRFRFASRFPSRTRALAAAGLLVLLAATVVFPAGAGAGTRAPDAVPTPEIDYFFVGSLNPRPLWITPGPDGNLWFTDTTANRVGRITPAGEITEFRVGRGKEPYQIVAGADGNLWFTERLNDKIGVVDTSGALVHEYAIPETDPRPTGITAGPNDDIWFANQGTGELVVNSVGRITLDGFVSVIDLFPCACFATGITTGPDGNIWATEELGVFEGESPGTLDRITPDGSSVTRFPVPQEPLTPGHLPAFPAPGPDGNVWFTEFAADVHSVGRVTPTGEVTEFTLPGTVTNSVGITTGIDGRMWITQGDASDIVVMNADGTVVTTIPTHQQPSGITIGPDGNMWFAAALDGEIGRINTARPGFAYILDIAPGFVPQARDIALGTTVEWVLEAPGLHRVADATGLDLYDSGPQPPVSFLTFRFTAAGKYPFVDPIGRERGVVRVPVFAPSASPSGDPFLVRWAGAAPGAGRVFDVQVKTPGSATWEAWQPGTTQSSASYTPAGPGTYSFRARLRNASGPGASGWSPPVDVEVS